MNEVRPQPGFQTKALSTPADVAILGGAAGCGKTYTLLLEFIRHVQNRLYGSVIFRREVPQITNEGGLWDTSETLYPLLGGTPVASRHYWRFPAGSKVSFKGLQYEKDLITWQGSQIPLIGFDELTHFSEKMFFYFFSRNRSTSGIKGYIRATCNPDPDSWVARFIEWWIDPETGDPIPERSGLLRYFAQHNGNYFWGSTFDECYELARPAFAEESLEGTDVPLNKLIKTVTFIPGNIKDNKILLQSDPGYLGALLALPEAEKNMLLRGNWKYSTTGMELFDYEGIRNIFTNIGVMEQDPRPLRCITVDPARFGRDFAVIMVWRGWAVIHLSVFKKSDVHDLKDHIEDLRRRHNVAKTDVMVDQDGLGGDLVTAGNYEGFHGGAKALADPETGEVENYQNLKTQCFYRMAKRVNAKEIHLEINQQTCQIFDDTSIKTKDGKMICHIGLDISVKGRVQNIRELIKADLRAIKREKIDYERKFTINTKEVQKEILGRSPDFADTLMMREYFVLRGTIARMKRIS